MKNERKSIAVIGGGYTGLVAALRLSSQGFDVTIFERNNEVGGLASGFQIQGTNIEKTYHHIFRTDTDIINLVKELGIEEKLKWYKGLTANFYNGKAYAFTMPIDFLKYPVVNIFERIRFGIIGLYLSKTKDWKRFVNISAYEWLSKWSGKQMMKVFWEPLLKGKFHEYYDKVSMAWLWARINTRGNSKGKDDPMVMLGYFDGGFYVIVKALLEKLEKNNVKIVTGANVEEIRKDKLEKINVKVDGQELKFDKVIATIPSYIFAKMIVRAIHELPLQDYLDKLNSIDYIGAAVMVFSSDQNLGKYYWYNINDLNAPFVVFLNHTNLVDKSKYNNKYIYYVGTYIPHDHKYFQMSDEEIEKLWFKYIKNMFPKFDKSKIIDKHLFKLKNAQHIVDLDYESKIPDHRTPLPNVYLANFSQIFPEDRGTNYAVRDGNKIADIVIKDLNNK